MYLIGTGATHIEQDGVFAPATVTSEIVRAHGEEAVEDNSGGLSADATVHASATVVGPDSVTVKFTLYDGDEAVAHGSSAAAGAGAHNASLSVSGAKVSSDTLSIRRAARLANPQKHRSCSSGRWARPTFTPS